jgi:type II secretory pathway pseudopilin PulG
MVVRFKQAGKRTAANAFTLAEVMIGFVIFGLVTAGMIYGYVQANRVAEWSSQSLAAMSCASQGIERMRAAQWSADEDFTTQNSTDVLPMTRKADGSFSYLTNEVNTMDIPGNGNPILVTNFLTVTQIHTNPHLRQIVSQVVWTFRLTGTQYTTTIVTLRAPDQYQ